MSDQAYVPAMSDKALRPSLAWRGRRGKDPHGGTTQGGDGGGGARRAGASGADLNKVWEPTFGRGA